MSVVSYDVLHKYVVYYDVLHKCVVGYDVLHKYVTHLLPGGQTLVPTTGLESTREECIVLMVGQCLKTLMLSNCSKTEQQY